MVAKHKQSLLNANPQLAHEWDPDKNTSLTPGSDKKVWKLSFISLCCEFVLYFNPICKKFEFNKTYKSNIN